MKKPYIIIICAAAIVLGGFYYFWNVATVKDYYLITIKADTEVKMEKLRNYESDSLAIVQQTAEKEARFKSLAEMFDTVLKEKFDADDDVEKMMKEAKLKAIEELMLQHYYLLSIEHVRSFDSEDFLELVKENGIFSDEVKEYTKKNKITTGVYQLD